MSVRSTLFSAAFIVVAASCFSGDVTGPIDPEEATFASSLGIDLDEMTKSSSGLYYQDLTVGEGEEAVDGAIVTVKYIGWLRDGNAFDQTGDDPSQPIELGAGQVIPGFEEGIIGMRVGGIRKLVIPSELGYGAYPQGPIPAHSILIFDVELVSVTIPEEEAA